MDMNYTVLENGIDFILMAVNDLSIINEAGTDDKTKKRLIKYSLLHLSSGIELVLKHRLLQEHWTYVFADMNKAKKEALQSGEFKSADSETIIERLKNLCDIELTPEDIKDLRNLRNKRNKAEHFNLNENLLSIESSIHKSMSITIKLIIEHYDLDEFTDEESELFSQIKVLLRQSQRHYNDAKTIAQRELEQTGMTSYVTTCPECEEEFLLRDDGAKCVFCGYEATGEDAARDYISNVLGISEYETVKHGGEYPQYECPVCGNEALVFNEETGKAICFSCDYEDDISNFTFCSSCGKPFVDTEDGIDICPECTDYIFHKDD
jgi:DNA-directed RNA polymerase subunit RPC12/RpoP